MKIGSSIKIINERYTRDLAGKCGKVIQIDWFDKDKAGGIAYLKLSSGRITSVNIDHIEVLEKIEYQELQLF